MATPISGGSIAYLYGGIPLISEGFEWYPYYSSYTPSQTLITETFEWWPSASTMAFVEGEPLISSIFSDAFLEGFGGTIEISTDAYIYGLVILSQVTSAYVDGQTFTSISGGTDAYILPYDNISQNSKAYILPKTTLDASEDAFIEGHGIIEYGIPAYIQGLDTLSTGISGFIDTATSIGVYADAYIWGVPSFPVYTNAIVVGYETITTAISGAVFVKDIVNINTYAYLDAKEAPTALIDAYVYGLATSILGISGYVDVSTTILCGEAAYIYGDTEIYASINAHLHVVDYIDISTLVYTLGYDTITGGILAHLHDYFDISISTNAYIHPINTGFISINAAIPDITDESIISTQAFLNGILGVTGVGVTGFMHGFDVANIDTNAYIDTSTSMMSSSNAYIWPWETGHTHTIPAYLSVDDYSSSGYVGFSHYGTVVLTDMSYNRVVTLRSEYYVGTGDIIFNTYLCNGTGNEVSDIRAITNTTWAGQIKLMRGTTPIVLTDNWNDSSVIISAMSNNSASFVPIIVTPSIGITGHVEIPIYVTYTNII